jgi:hypothetical protein
MLRTFKFDYKSNLNLTKNQIDVIFFLSAKHSEIIEVLLSDRATKKETIMDQPEIHIKPETTPPFKNPFFPPEHIVAFYTLLTVLTKMKKELGLEAMLEYMALYLKEIDSHNPKLAMAVAKTLELIPIEVFYHELGKDYKDQD